ncbi:uncharacterized protein LOC128921798 [Zeugodacus cucurbitae]|uniref:uncharacterized protein LOC128921798 n=1 Tax=Zeugodacus cucurbitae TaxID=28588 RepID=UPI0023D961D0|nr:uncharacterized protein LOC128921798 [Zeugodacus cucurbitae]
MFKFKSYVPTAILVLLFSNSSNFVTAICNACSRTTNLACISQTHFQVCVNGIPTGTPTSCPSGYICSTTSNGICRSIDDTNTVGDCTESTTVGTTTTNRYFFNPVAFCQTIQINGRFPVGNNLTTTCKAYVYCFINGNVWSGALYFCPGATYFDSSTRYCTPNVPARCVSSTL